MKKKALLWQITDPSSRLVCAYIGGTMHLNTDIAYTYKDFFERYIDQCDIYAGEMDVTQADPGLLRQAMTLPEQKTMEDLLGTKKYLKVKKQILKSYKLDIEPYKTQTPFSLVALLQQQKVKDGEEHDRPNLDEALFIHALGNQKPVTGLESFEHQLEILKKIPMGYQIGLLLKTMKNSKKQSSKAKKLNRYYESADIYNLQKQGKASLGKIRKLLLTDRNINMVSKLVELIQQNTVFATVGAGHLAGKYGMIRLLKEKGFIVKPLFLQTEPDSAGE